MVLSLQDLTVDQITGQTSGTPIYIQDTSGNFVPIGTIATGGAVTPITPAPTDLMTRDEIKGLVTLSIDTALDDYDKRFLKMKSEFKSLEKKVLQELKGKRGEMPIIVTKEVTYLEGKKMVKEYMKKHKTTDIEKLHKALKINISLLIDIIDEFIEEGQIV